MHERRSIDDLSAVSQNISVSSPDLVVLNSKRRSMIWSTLVCGFESKKEEEGRNNKEISKVRHLPHGSTRSKRS